MTNTNSNNGQGYPPSVLIVEDSPPQALKLKLALEHNGCNVYWSETGLGGLGMAQEKIFDLIVLDVELPDINGFEVCKSYAYHARPSRKCASWIRSRCS